MTRTIESGNLFVRVRSMLKLDFYRLFHTPAFYIMLLIAAIIPALIMTSSGVDPNAAGTAVENTVAAAPVTEIENAWQLVESTRGTASEYNMMNMGAFANINMLYIFAGLLMSIFVAHDYSSGFAKNIFTVHARKVDYVISKTAIGIFGGMGMIVTYLIGTVAAGITTGKAFDVNVGGLVMCLLSKVFLMGLFCSLFLAISVFFRSKLWLTIVCTFLFGMMLYPTASVATLGSTVMTVLVSLVMGIVGAVVIGFISSLILNKRDLA
jgi:hypothetical protein